MTQDADIESVLYQHPAGPRVTYGLHLLVIEDLNPQLRTQWRMTRWEMFVFGLKAIWAAGSAP